MARMDKKKFELVKILGGQVTRSFYSSIEELSQDKDYRFWDTRRRMEKAAHEKYITEKGEKKGLKEGEKKGVKKVALKMKQDGMSLSKISEITGLSKEEIKKLSKKEIKKIKQRRN